MGDSLPIQATARTNNPRRAVGVAIRFSPEVLLVVSLVFGIVDRTGRITALEIAIVGLVIAFLAGNSRTDDVPPTLVGWTGRR
jgi:hypothetical protein